MSSEVRVRYAPSPTGHLHIGGARTALFNYLFARSMNGKFIIRIEDTDLKRNIEGGDENQLNYLQWLGMDWDESVDKVGGYGPYRQTERLNIYKKYYEDLFSSGHVYKCYCTEEEIEAEREIQAANGQMPQYSGKCRSLSKEEQEAKEACGITPSVRFKVPENKNYTFDDMVRGTVSFETNDIGDFVIVKKNDIPTYNFAVVVDDYEMKISHVLRGEEHISNTPRQLMIYDAFGWEPPTFGHMTLIVNEQRKKLSKRDESIVQFIEQYKSMGYLPEALFNFIGLLGWSPEGEEEIFTQEQFISIFDVNRLSKSPAMFDRDKLAWMNAHYLKKLSSEEIAQLALPYLQQAGLLPTDLSDEQREWATQLIVLFQEKMKCGADIVELSSMFFTDDIAYDEEALAVLKEEQVPQVLTVFIDQLKSFDTLQAEDVKTALKNVQKETGFKGKQLFMPARIAATGQVHGPDLNQSIALLGRDKVISRISSLIDNYTATVRQ